MSYQIILYLMEDLSHQNVGIHRHFYQNRFKDQCAKNNFAKIHYPGVTESKSKGDIEEHMFLEIQVI